MDAPTLKWADCCLACASFERSVVDGEDMGECLTHSISVFYDNVCDDFMEPDYEPGEDE